MTGSRSNDVRGRYPTQLSYTGSGIRSGSGIGMEDILILGDLKLINVIGLTTRSLRQYLPNDGEGMTSIEKFNDLENTL